MKFVRITVLKKTIYQDLINKYENPNLIDTCTIKVGDVFIIEEDLEKPVGLCESAYKTILPFAKNLLENEERIYGDWMKNNDSYMVSCDDGFRPVTFLVELIKND